MFYVVTTSGWADGAGWQYTDEVQETGEVQDMEHMDVEGTLVDLFNGGYVPRTGYDTKWEVKLYASKDGYENGAAPVCVQEVWEQAEYKSYNDV